MAAWRAAGVRLDGLPPDTPVEALAARLVRENGAALPLFVSSDPAEALPQADVVLVATSNTGRFIAPEMLKPEAVVCDLSRPQNLSVSILDARPDIIAIDGGIVEPWGAPDLGADYGLQPEHTYACMAETMLLGLERHFQDSSLGLAPHDEDLRLLRRLALRHGYRVAAPTCFDAPLDLSHRTPSRMTAS